MSASQYSSQLVMFRVDASMEIGSGHVMRCLTLADELTERGVECQFICRSLSANLIRHIEDRGYCVHVLQQEGQKCGSASKVEFGAKASPVHAEWLGVTQEEDAVQCVPLVGERQPDWLVVDHYGLDVRWESIVKPDYTRLLAIDDLADRPHLSTVLLDQNLGRCSVDYADLVPESCQVYVGPRFALLRPEFRELRRESLQRRSRPQLKRLLISMGGVDKDNATGKVLEALKECSLPEDLQVNVIMSAQAPWLNAVTLQAKNMPWAVEVAVNVQNMGKRMADADLAIGAGGGTAWERCCLGLPALIIVLAENQWAGARALVSAGAAELIGTLADLDDTFPARLEKLSGRSALSRMARTAARITDGGGVRRVCDAMEVARG